MCLGQPKLGLGARWMELCRGGVNMPTRAAMVRAGCIDYMGETVQ